MSLRFWRRWKTGSRIAPPGDLFKDVRLDRAAFDASMVWPRAEKTYAIFFTPRSGSTWLTDALGSTDRLGKPGEWFNPKRVPHNAHHMNADTLERYIERLRRVRGKGGVFGFEVTWGQLEATFGSGDAYLAHFPAVTPSLYLTRQDIVAQAISLAKLVVASVSHSSLVDADDIRAVDANFKYDAKLIKRWIRHIIGYEENFERFFAANGIEPHRVVYETMIPNGAQAIAETVARLCDVPADTVTAKSTTERVGSDKNRDFAERFRREQPKFLKSIAARRTLKTTI